MPQKKSKSKEGRSVFSKIGKQTGLIVIILAAVLLQVISAIQYHHTRGLLEEELEKSALRDLITSALRIQEILT